MHFYLVHIWRHCTIDKPGNKGKRKQGKIWETLSITVSFSRVTWITIVTKIILLIKWMQPWKNSSFFPARFGNRFYFIDFISLCSLVRTQRYRDIAHFIKLVLCMENLHLLSNLLSLSYGGSRTGIIFFIEQVERAKTKTKEMQPIQS